MNIEQIIKNIFDLITRFKNHKHNGTDSLPIDIQDTVGNLSVERVTGASTGGGSATLPAGVNGDIQINASGVFGVVGGMNVGQTGNTRGANSLDIQSLRSAVTQVASGADSTAIGQKNTASNKYSMAIGWNNTASGYGSTVSGYHNTASGAYSVAAGYNSTSSGKASQAYGYGNTSSANYTVALGTGNKARGTDDVAIGFGNTTKSGGYSSVALGISNTVSSNYGMAIGVSVTASADDSIAIGHNITNGTANSILIASTGNGGRLQITKSGTIDLVNNNNNSATTQNITISTGDVATTNTAGSIDIKAGKPGNSLGTSGNLTVETSDFAALGGTLVVKRGTSATLTLDQGTSGRVTIFSNDPINLYSASYINADSGGGGWNGGIRIGNVGSAPGTPTGGGILYVTAGALHYIGSSGTDTPIAPS